MPVRMVHPDHGVLHAVGSEVEWNLKNGWKVEEETPSAPPLVDYAVSGVGQKEPPALDLEQLRIQWQAKHGEKPHHRKSAETLRKEL